MAHGVAVLELFQVACASLWPSPSVQRSPHTRRMCPSVGLFRCATFTVNRQAFRPEVPVPYVIAMVELESTCVGDQCSSTSLLRVFDYDDGGGVYTQVSSTPSPSISATNVGLYVDNGGAPVDLDTAPTGITVQPTIPNSVLFAAGYFNVPTAGGWQ